MWGSKTCLPGAMRHSNLGERALTTSNNQFSKKGVLADGTELPFRLIRRRWCVAVFGLHSDNTVASYAAYGPTPNE